jgi:hypothetical protein
MKLFSPFALSALPYGTHSYARGVQVGETNALEIHPRGRTNDAGAFQDGDNYDVDLDRRRSSPDVLSRSEARTRGGFDEAALPRRARHDAGRGPNRQTIIQSQGGNRAVITQN